MECQDAHERGSKTPAFMADADAVITDPRPDVATSSPLTKEITVSDARNVVLVHGGFVDGSGWEGVYRLLKQDGFNVSVVQNPTLSLDDDVAVTRRVLDKQDGPTILVGHSYGGGGSTPAGKPEKGAGAAHIPPLSPH